MTGGAGFIGSHTCKLLLKQSFIPIVLDNLSTGNRWAAPPNLFIEADLADAAKVYEVFATYPIKAVIHFAASAYVGESIEDPHKYFRNNLSNTINLLGAMLESGVRTIVFSSTCATYGVPSQIPITEDHPQHPVNPYGESKLFVERILRWYGDAYGFRYALLRYFNAAGADPEGFLGEDHRPETHLIPLCIEAALGRGRLKVYGTDYPTNDGTAVRDFVHVIDLAKAHIAALKWLRSGGPSGAWNLGTGKGHSVLEVIRTVETVSGHRVPCDFRPMRDGDAPILVADHTKAARELCWKPEFMELAHIVSTAWQWHARRQAVGIPA